MILKKKEIILIGIIVLIGLLLRLWGIDHNLPLLPDPDEQMNVNRSLAFGSGDLNPHNFKHPATHQYMISILYGIYFVILYLSGSVSSSHDFELAFISDPTYFYLIARVFIAVLGTATIFLLYLISKENYDETKGLIASAFLSISPIHVINYVPKGEIPTTFFICLSFFYLLRIYKSGMKRDYILAGISSGLAIGTKYYSGLIIVPLFVSHFFYKYKGKGSQIIDKNLSLSLIFMTLSFLLTNPYILLDFKTFWEFFTYQATQPLWDPKTFSGFGSGHIFFFKALLTKGLGIILGSVALTGVIFALFSRNKIDKIILSFVFIFYLIVGGTNLPNFRYITPMIPFIVLLGANFFIGFLGIFFNRIKGKEIFLLIISILVILHPIYNLIIFKKRINEKDIRLVVKEWVEENIPENSKILLTGLNVAMTKAAPLEDNLSGLKEKLSSLKEENVWGISTSHLSRYYRLKIEVLEKGMVKSKTYELTSTKGGKNIKPMQYYIDNKYDFFVLSDEIDVPSWNEKRKKVFPNVVAFYNELKNSTLMIKYFEGQGIRIGIFKLKKPSI